MALFKFSLVLAVLAAIAAAALAKMLRKHLLASHRRVDSPSGLERSPFWVLHFLSPKRWRELPSRWKPLAALALAAHLLSILLLSVLLFWFAASGAEL